MISIKDTVGTLLVPCPKCKSTVFVEQWGEQTCLHERCDGHKFRVEFNADWALLMLKQIERKNVVSKSLTKTPLMRPSMPKLKATIDGWITVPQPDSINSANWFSNDPFKK